MLTKPECWDELWGADGTRCSYQILFHLGTPPSVGDCVINSSGVLYEVIRADSLYVVLEKMDFPEQAYERPWYSCPIELESNFVYVPVSSSWSLLYTGDNDLEEESLILDKAVFTAAKPIGNTPCFTLECCLRHKGADIPKGAWLELQIRLQNSTKATDWVSLGKFKVNKRVKYPDGWVKLSCRDRMQMANQLFIKDESVDVTTWPKPMNEVMSMSLDIMGITLDPSTTINEGEGWVVSLPLGLSIRTIWSSIAAAHGGNFIITPQDTLKLIQPKNPVQFYEDIHILGDNVFTDWEECQFYPYPGETYSVFLDDTRYVCPAYSIEIEPECVFLGNYLVEDPEGEYPEYHTGEPFLLLFRRGTHQNPEYRAVHDYAGRYKVAIATSIVDAPSIPTELSEDGFELLGDPVTVDRLTLSTNELHIMAGDSGDNNIDVECLYASPEAALYAKSQLEGLLYTPVKCSSMVFDPLAEVYDTFLVNEVLTTWSQLTVKCGIIPLADGVADTSAEPASEYGFEDTPLNEIKSQIKAVSESIDAADRDSFEKVTQEELFNKLTNNGTAQGLFFMNGQIFINAAYLASGTIQADLIKSGILASKDGSFSLNLDTGEFTVTGLASRADLEALRQDGVEKIVTPVMKYSMSDDGLRIQKPGEEIGNKMTHEGMEVSRGSEPMLRANKDGVLATDVTVRNFLNMGENCRFEDYSDGVDTARTGCFAM